ncbi:hypothetical protein [Paraburkholderia sp. PGU19]|uniref:hypothetical protein n=1 Tax=Paraburkholderia sp. PGU19 TaxID=2735434 RepID=UPI001FB0A5A2|nr:hypothetical protein [Paraburkholderia sp. PGU19]
MSFAVVSEHKRFTGFRQAGYCCDEMKHAVKRSRCRAPKRVTSSAKRACSARATTATRFAPKRAALLVLPAEVVLARWQRDSSFAIDWIQILPGN